MFASISAFYAEKQPEGAEGSDVHDVNELRVDVTASVQEMAERAWIPLADANGRLAVQLTDAPLPSKTVREASDSVPSRSHRSTQQKRPSLSPSGGMRQTGNASDLTWRTSTAGKSGPWRP